MQAKAKDAAENRLLGIVEVMNRLSVSRSKVYLMIKAGQLRPVKLGASVRFKSADIAEIVERGV